MLRQETRIQKGNPSLSLGPLSYVWNLEHAQMPSQVVGEGRTQPGKVETSLKRQSVRESRPYEYRLQGVGSHFVTPVHLVVCSMLTRISQGSAEQFFCSSCQQIFMWLYSVHEPACSWAQLETLGWLVSFLPHPLHDQPRLFSVASPCGFST